MCVTTKGVIELIKGLKNRKAPGPDEIRKEDLMIDTTLMAEILTTIFQCSIDMGVLPDCWKSAHVVPIFKSGEHNLPCNYRPVSLTSICCKLLEHILVTHIRTKLDSYLHSNQHGFRKGLSCTTQLAATVHHIGSLMNKQENIQAVVLDFAKAFDKVPHDKLVSKLLNMGLDNCSVTWIKSFLQGRSQEVMLKGERSIRLPVTSGVPQGSVLGPVLFLIYINDIFDSVSESTLRLYADDALMYLTMNPLNNELFQRDLDNLYQWAIVNGMSFNIKKCRSIFFSNHPCDGVRHTLCGEQLERASSFVYLGVNLSGNFSFSEHIDNVILKANRSLGLLRRTLFHAPRELRLTAFKSMCRSQLEYASEVWDPYKRKDIERLEMVQRRAVRFICGLKGVCSVTEARESLLLDSLEDRRKEKRKRLFCRIVAGDTSDNCLRSSFPAISELFPSTIYNTRSSSTTNLLPAMSCQTTAFLQSLFPRTSRELRLN